MYIYLWFEKKSGAPRHAAMWTQQTPTRPNNQEVYQNGKITKNNDNTYIYVCIFIYTYKYIYIYIYIYINIW